MAEIRLAVITYVHEAVNLGHEGETIGNKIDRMIETALSEGSLVADVTVEFTEEERHRMRSDYHAGPMAPVMADKKRVTR